MHTSTAALAHFAPKATVSQGDGPGLGNPAIQTTLHYYNNLPIPITVVDRLGIKSQIQGARSQYSGEFIIRQVEKYQPSVNLDIGDLLDDCGAQPSALAISIANVLGGNRTGKRSLLFGQSDLTKDFSITLDNIRQNGGSIYVVGLDVVLTVLPPDQAPAHPHQMSTRRMALLGPDNICNRDSGFHYQIKIVDSAGVYGKRYINILGDVFAVPVVNDTGYQDGVYVVSSHPSPTGEVYTYPRADYLQFDVADKKLGLYRTPLEAETLGDPQSAHKRELEARAYQLKLDEHAMKVEKQRIDREAMDRAAEFERNKNKWEAEAAERQLRQDLSEQAWKERKHQLDQESLIVKDRLDARSTSRKAVLETLKYGPSIAVGLWAIFKTIQKLQEKK